MANKTIVQLPAATGINVSDIILLRQAGIDKQMSASGVCITTGQVQTISGVKTFASIPVGPASDPTTDNQLTRKKYVDDSSPPGSIIMYGGAVAPSGWELCDGGLVLRTGSGVNLFTAIGTTFGVGNGTTTFNKPNMQGIFPRGAGSQIINARSKGGGSLGDINEDHGQAWQLGADQDDSGAREYWGRVADRDDIVDSSTQANQTIPKYGTSAFQGASTMLHAKNDGTNGDPREGATTEPSSLDLNYIIKL